MSLQSALLFPQQRGEFSRYHNAAHLIDVCQGAVEAEAEAGLIHRFAPVRRVDVDRLICFGFEPAGEDAAAREYQRVQSFHIESSKFQIAVKGRGRNWLLLHYESAAFQL